MKQLVIMPGGFHPFHAGHAALYQSAVKAFPGADVYVAATNDTSTRPFPFPVKEKLAQLAGVSKGRFMRVKSPFRAEEITAPYDPNTTQLIFVRSEKDAGSQPRPGGVKKDGTPGYLQPYDDASDLPMSQQAYMAYLPTVEFGPGMTSATEIRGAWPQLNEKRKTALVMSLYPKTQTNPKLAATVVKLLDTAMGVVDESALDNLPRPNKRNQFKSLHKQRKQRGLDEVDAQNFVGGMTADYQSRENQPVSEGPFVQRIMHPGKVSIYVRSGKVPKLVATDIPYEILDKYIAKVISKYPQFKPSDFSFRSSDKISENTAPNPRVDLTPNYPNYATLVGEFIGVKKNRVLFRIVSAELKPGQGETEKIFRAMSTNTPIGIEISKVKNRAVLENVDKEFILYIDGKPAAKYMDQQQAILDMAAVRKKYPSAKLELKHEVCTMQTVQQVNEGGSILEVLKPDAFKALQQAKQRNAQNRQQEVDQWAQDFRANSSKLAGQQLKQRLAAPPPAPIPVARPGEGFYALKDRLAQLDIAKQKFEEFNRLIASIKKKYPLVAVTLDTLENSLLQDVKDGAADNYASLLTKLNKYETALTTRFPSIVKEDPDYIEEGRKI
jgi:hypothetical protein